MSRNTLLISPADLKSRSAVHLNYDEKQLAPEIKVAQDQYIQEALGTELLIRLQLAIEGGALSADEQALLDDVQDALVWFTLAGLVTSGSFQLFTKGLLRQSGQNWETPSMQDIMQLANGYKNRGEFYRERLIRYLSLNGSQFPEYAAAQSDIAPRKIGYTVQCWLPEDESC